MAVSKLSAASPGERAAPKRRRRARGTQTPTRVLHGCYSHSGQQNTVTMVAPLTLICPPGAKPGTKTPGILQVHGGPHGLYGWAFFLLALVASMLTLHFAGRILMNFTLLTSVEFERDSDHVDQVSGARVRVEKDARQWL